MFDLDGTLIDTIPLIVASHRHAVQTVLGHDLSDEVLKSGIGRPLIDQMRVFDEPRAQELFDTYRVWNHANTAALLGRFAGVDDVLARHGATAARLTFCGHVHRPMLYHLTPTGKLASFDPGERIDIPMTGYRRWLVVVGAVGQPRDRNPAACYAMLDDASDALTFFRIPYDIEKAAEKIRHAGLPEWLAMRLFEGM